MDTTVGITSGSSISYTTSSPVNGSLPTARPIRKSDLASKNLKTGDSQRAKLISQVGEKLLKLSDLIDEYEVMNKDATKIAEAYSKVNNVHQGMIRDR